MLATTTVKLRIRPVVGSHAMTAGLSVSRLHQRPHQRVAGIERRKRDRIALAAKRRRRRRGGGGGRGALALCAGASGRRRTNAKYPAAPPRDQQRDRDPHADRPRRRRRQIGFAGRPVKLEVRQIGHVGLRDSAIRCSTWWTNETAIDPSPTADATRLTLPPRTSPTAKTPGRLVSSRCGGRGSGQRAAVEILASRSGPVLMKPFVSSATQPSSQRGVRHRAGHDEHVADVCALSTRRSRCSRQRTRSSRSPPSSADDLGVRAQLDRGVVLDAANQIARHALGQAAATHEHVARAWRSAPETPPPGRRSCRRRRRSPLRRRTAALRRRSRRSRRRRLRTAPGSRARAAGTARRWR